MEPRHPLPAGCAGGDPREGITDLAHDLAGAVATRTHRIRRSYWEHGAPICWPPPDRYADVRRTARQVLPGVRYRRHVMWRYSLVWPRPATA